jgi:nucleoside-diphosphate-sugar epimerase
VSRNSILVVGANGELGRALLHELGPDTAIAATRTGHSPLPGFDHAPLEPDGTPPASALARCRAVINAAGTVTGDGATMETANIRLPLAIARAAKIAGVARMVQVSSFATAGTAEHIDADTPERPINAYGQSKAIGDRKILALAADGFGIECLRLPFMFSATKPGLLSSLLSFSDGLRLLPGRADRPFRRSMFTYADAARALIACTTGSRNGISFAADPQLFDYSLLATILAEEAGRSVRIVPVPGPVVAAINRLVPAVGRRLFRSNVLAPSANSAGESPLGLEAELRQLVRNRYRRLKGSLPND